MADPRHDCDVNLGGLLNLMTAAVKAGSVKQVLLASSGGAAYGDTDVIPTPEEHPTRPVSHYGVAKAASELYLHVFRVQHGIPFAALRYANVYGPRQDPHGEAGVVAIFAERLTDRPARACTLFGDGKQTRDYVFVGDVARANLLAAEKRYDGVVNVGTGVETDLHQLYAAIARAAASDIPPQFAPQKPGEQRRSCIDPRFASRALGWKPEVALEEGIRRTVAWFAARKTGR
jgi:UDP-glucose 4-epimerase